MKHFKNILGIVIGLCLIFILLISSVEFVVYGIPGYFEKEYSKYKVDETVSMEMDDLLYVTAEMMDYLKGKRDDLHIETVIDGQAREFFNQREIDHMADVRDLFLKGMALRNYSLGIIIIALIILVILKTDLKRTLPPMILLGTVLLLGVSVIGGLIISTDFTRAFTIFHELLFTNDLWILDPATDLLINIVPEPFFIDTALYIGITFGVSMFILLGISTCLWRRNKL